jgi:protease I
VRRHVLFTSVKDQVQAWNHFEKGDRFPVEVPFGEADSRDFDALLLPGGVANPDQLRIIPEAVKSTREFFPPTNLLPRSVMVHGR